MSSFWAQSPGFWVDLFPLLVAEHDVEVDVVFSVVSELVTDLVDPLEVLPSLPPVVVQLVLLLAKQQQAGVVKMFCVYLPLFCSERF